jgi:hypothetical protein
MDQSRFDALARDVWQSHTRRRLMGRLAILPVLSAIATLLPPPEEVDAAHPGQRLQHRKDDKRSHARRRREHRRDTQRRDLGAGSGDCPADKRRGDECETDCQCRGALRCGARRLQDQRAECGQPEDPYPDLQVCCLGQGDSCKNNDCECCGTLSCHLGRCRVRDGTTCAPGMVHHRGTCIGNGACTPNSEYGLPCGPAACGQADFGPDAQSECATTAEGGRVCVGRPPTDTDATTVPRSCTQSADCPADQVCIPFVLLDRPFLGCLPVCGPPS